MHSEGIKLINSLTSNSLEAIRFKNGRVESVFFKQQEYKMRDTLCVDTSAMDDLLYQAQKEAEYNKQLSLQDQESDNNNLKPYENKAILNLIKTTSRLIELIKKH